MEIQAEKEKLDQIDQKAKDRQDREEETAALREEIARKNAEIAELRQRLQEK